MTFQSALTRASWTLLATALLFLFLREAAHRFPRLYVRLRRWGRGRLRGWRVKSVVLIPADRLIEALLTAARGFRWLSIAAAGYLYLFAVLSLFPQTRRWGRVSLTYILDPLQTILRSLINFLPNLLFISAVGLLTFYALKLLRLVFTEIGRGRLSIAGFYPEWAEPTFKIVRFFVLAFMLVVLFPYLPGAQSPAFRGISVFLGVLFSLGSSSAVSNIVAGTVITYMRAFQVGDFVEIDGVTGEVIEKNLLVTRLRTLKNIEVSIPNSRVLGGALVNRSARARRDGVALHTSVGLGYDVPWRQVHELMIAAAADVPGVRRWPAPFVLQTALNDFCVSYELNAFTDRPHDGPRILSRIHENIQDRFRDAGIEILSPHVMQVRSSNGASTPSFDAHEVTP